MQRFYYKMQQLLQNATISLRNTTVITKRNACNNACYNICQYIVQRLTKTIKISCPNQVKINEPSHPVSTVHVFYISKTFGRNLPSTTSKP